MAPIRYVDDAAPSRRRTPQPERLAGGHRGALLRGRPPPRDDAAPRALLPQLATAVVAARLGGERGSAVAEACSKTPPASATASKVLPLSFHAPSPCAAPGSKLAVRGHGAGKRVGVGESGRAGHSVPGHGTVRSEARRSERAQIVRVRLHLSIVCCMALARAQHGRGAVGIASSLVAIPDTAIYITDIYYTFLKLFMRTRNMISALGRFRCTYLHMFHMMK